MRTVSEWASVDPSGDIAESSVASLSHIVVHGEDRLPNRLVLAAQFSEVSEAERTAPASGNAMYVCD